MDAPGQRRRLLLGVFLLLGLVLVAVALYLSFADRRTDSKTLGNHEEADDADAAAAARAAGKSANRLWTEESVENEIFRAWYEMAERLDVDRPTTSTPEEFATAALEAGLHAGAVRELTELFTEVRYGDFEATADREVRARDALRRIEDRYGSETDLGVEHREGVGDR